MHRSAPSEPAYQHITDLCSSPLAGDAPPSPMEKSSLHSLAQGQYETTDEIPMHSFMNTGEPAEIYQQRQRSPRAFGRWTPSKRLQRLSDAWSRVSKHPYCRWAGNTWCLRIVRAAVILSHLALVLEGYSDWLYTVAEFGRLEIITSSIAVVWDALALIADLSKQESPLILPVIPATVEVMASLLMIIIMVLNLHVLSLVSDGGVNVAKPSLYVATGFLLLLLLSLGGTINYRSCKDLKAQMRYYRAYRNVEPIVVFRADGKAVAAFPYEPGHNGLAP